MKNCSFCYTLKNTLSLLVHNFPKAIDIQIDGIMSAIPTQ